MRPLLLEEVPVDKVSPEQVVARNPVPGLAREGTGPAHRWAVQMGHDLQI